MKKFVSLIVLSSFAATAFCQVRTVSPLAKAGPLSLEVVCTPETGNPLNFAVSQMSFDIEQTLNIGSQSSGAGAGKVTFNPFSITRKVDASSPSLFQMACSGRPFKSVAVRVGKATYTFKLVAVKAINYSASSDAPNETIETVQFLYGGVNISTGAAAGETLGWNRVMNAAWNDVTKP